MVGSLEMEHQLDMIACLWGQGVFDDVLLYIKKWRGAAGENNKHTCTHMHMHAHTQTDGQTHIHRHTHMYVHTHKYICACKHTCMVRFLMMH